MRHSLGKYLVVVGLILGFLSGCSRGPLSLKWHKRFKTGLFSPFSSDVVSSSSLQIEGQELYFGTAKGHLVCYDLAYRRVKWRFKTGSPVEGTPLVLEDRIFFGNSDGNFFSVERGTGKKDWMYHSEGEVYSKPAIHYGIVYFSSAGGLVSALDAKSGEWLWHYKRGYPKGVTILGVSSPTLVEDKIVVVGFEDGYVVAFNPNDGSLVWEKKIGKGRFLDVDAAPLYSNGKVFIPTFEDGLYALNTEGEVLWKFEEGGTASGVLLEDDFIYFASNNGHLYKLKKDDGGVLWNAKFEPEATTNPVSLDDLIVFGTYNGSLYAFNKEDGSGKWRYKFSAEIKGEILSHLNKVYLITSKGDLFVFGPR